MREKQQLEATLNLIDDSSGKLFKHYRLRIAFIISIAIILAVSIYMLPNLNGVLQHQFSFIIFFFLGVGTQKWESLNNLKRLLPHLNKQSIKNRLGEIDT
ncbi:hypothetical protein [Pseudoalteromonas sp. T1lg48]|uniref:hypothetical protein n=1 Tax=Pseudoalteromonas sp. T1lg48 TaxID=2077100 RepID=UPI000CF5F76A|nr:hypothetical protein [Pseudoalteromonas sp. T1lg48]